MKEDQQRIERRLRHTHFESIEQKRLCLLHSFSLISGIEPLVPRVLEADRHAVHLYRHPVGNQVIVLVMVQLFVELKRIRKSLPHDRTRRMVLLGPHIEVYVPPSAVMRLRIERRQPCSFHQHGMNTCVLECRPSFFQCVLERHLILHRRHTDTLHLRTYSSRKRLLVQSRRKDQRTCSLLGVKRQKERCLLLLPNNLFSPQRSANER